MPASRDERQLINRLTPLPAVLARIDSLVGPVASRPMAVASARNRVLAADLVVEEMRPARALAWRDGWAVRAESTADAGPYAPAPLGAAAAVDIGDALPPGADAVAPPDAVRLRGPNAEALAPVAPDEGVLTPGADATRGERLVPAGARLRLTDVAALQGLGISQVHVREPRIAIASARASRDDGIDAILNWLRGAVSDAGCVATTAETAFDSMDNEFFSAPPDALLVIGGTGSGSRDRSIRALARLGRVEAHGIGLSPGETAAFGMVASCPVLVLPGRLDAAFAVWLAVGRRLLACLCGGGGDAPACKATLSRKAASSLGLVDIVPVRRLGDAVEPLASGHLPLSALAQADGWIAIPADSEGYPAGATVDVRPLP